MAEREKRIGGLWLNEGKRGKYMSGSIDLPDGTKLGIVIFKNRNKQPGERFPDYEIFKKQKRETGAY